ncbi:MAG: NADPH:quinone reductase [Candidatus Limiplasma sp.]|nr:NADPH:quinone reductase [Candidatus Limiplasma sp.]
MKAIQMKATGGIEVLTLAEVAEPPVGENEVKVKLFYAGINPSDTYIREGGYASFSPALPYTFGFDGSGIIEEIGNNVNNLKTGDRVFIASTLSAKTTGTYAEKVVCNMDAVRKLPLTATFEEGASVGVPAAAAYRAVFQRGKLKKGERVLIHGASGGVGSLAVQMAKHHGAYVIGTAGSPEGMDTVQKCGADAVLNHHDSGYLEHIPPVDLVIEMLANVNLEKDLQVIGKYGRIVVVGNRGTLDFNPRLIMAKEADVLGMALWNFPPEDYQQCLDTIEEMLESRAIRPVIGKVYPLEEAGNAQFDVIHKKSQGKLLLKTQTE